MFSSIKSIKKLDKNLIIFLFSLTLISMAAINISKFIEVYIGDAKNIGNFVAVTGIVGILTTIIIVPQIIKLKKDINIIILVTFLSGIVIFIVFRINNVMLSLYTLFMFYVMFKSIYAPLETSFISSHAGVGEYGKIMGIRQFFFAIGFVIGPLVGGLLLDINALYVFDLSVVLFLIGAILILIVRNNINKVIVIDKEQI